MATAGVVAVAFDVVDAEFVPLASLGRDPALSRLGPDLLGASGTVTDLSPATVSPTSVIEVWLERLDPARGEDFGWKRVDVREASPGRNVPPAAGWCSSSTSS